MLREALVLEVEFQVPFLCFSGSHSYPNLARVYIAYHITYIVHNAGQQGISALR